MIVLISCKRAAADYALPFGTANTAFKQYRMHPFIFAWEWPFKYFLARNNNDEQSLRYEHRAGGRKGGHALTPF